jgi:iron complex transport system ATP-binding protein
MAGLLKPKTGSISFAEQALSEINHKAYAKKVSLLLQSSMPPEGFTVKQVVMLGRVPYLGLLGKPSKIDNEIVEKAIAEVRLVEQQGKLLVELSGGQQQRAWIAMAIAQNTPCVLLDEPTTFLDLTYQVQLLDSLVDLKEKHKKTIVMIIHDLNLASYYADELIVINNGQVVAQGETQSVLTTSLMEEVFKVKSVELCCERTNRRTFVPFA